MISTIILIIIAVTILQIPLWIDIMHATFPSTSRIPRCVSTTFRPLLILFITILCAYAIILYQAVFLPIAIHGEVMYHNFTSTEEALAAFNTPISYLSPRAILYTFIAYWLWLNMFSHYVLAVVSPPSRILLPSQTPPSTLVLSPPCQYCHTTHAPRTRYCRVCVRCVELMDHHCPFTGNCVGRENFQYFWMWLTGMLVGLGYALFMSWSPFNVCVLQTLIYGRNVIGTIKFIPACAVTGSTCLIFLPIVFVEWMLSILWCWETYLLYRDITTIEFLKRVTKGTTWNGGMRNTWNILWKHEQHPIEMKVVDEEAQTRLDPPPHRVSTTSSLPPSARKTFPHLIFKGHHWTALLVPPPIWWCLSLIGIHRCRTRVTKEG